MPDDGIAMPAAGDKGLLRLLTCGSVDDGKSTLIGRLLYDSKLLFEDHLAALRKDSGKYGTTGGDIDFALLVDGLEAKPVGALPGWRPRVQDFAKPGDAGLGRPSGARGRVSQPV